MIDASISTTRRARRGMLREWRLHALSVAVQQVPHHVELAVCGSLAEQVQRLVGTLRVREEARHGGPLAVFSGIDHGGSERVL